MKDENDVLRYALENGMIDLLCIQEQVEMNKRKELLSKHESKIWQGKDGRWYTYIHEKDDKRKRVIKEDYEEVFNDNEMNKLISYMIENLDVWNIGLLLMFFTGIRVGELVVLKHSDFHDDSVDIRRTETVQKDDFGVTHYNVKEFPKTAAGVRTVIIPSDYIWILNKIKALNPFGEYVFVNQKGERMTTFCFRNRLYRICKKLGIYRKSPHKIRKTYGSILLDNHIDNRLIMKQMGHTDILCTETRYHRDRRDHDEKAVIISNIPQFKVQ